jgi:hypothetical protein
MVQHFGILRQTACIESFLSIHWHNLILFRKSEEIGGIFVYLAAQKFKFFSKYETKLKNLQQIAASSYPGPIQWYIPLSGKSNLAGRYFN